ncbi:hypothetical protein [Oricola nitratireducens]|uniref:hypothetical protein n=1 Tax=Oricola nitratireducens TaxID=2775868 RepID=UPI0018666162|nr:hypothetical protein [Oricola nitratireducens]
MPRPADPMNAARQLRQRDYRARLRAAGCPEASAIDIVLAEAVARQVSRAARDGKLEPTGELGIVIRIALRRLVELGYDADHARRKTRQRLGRFACGAFVRD